MLLGLTFGAMAVLVVPLAALMGLGPRSALAHLRRAPFVGDVLDAWRARLDGGALDRVEGLSEALLPACESAGVDPALIGAICWAESRGRSGQRSGKGALGLMQLVPAAARDAARRAQIALPDDEAELEAELLTNDRLNLSLGAAHVAWLLEHRGDWSLEAVLVSYNAGRARLFQWIERHGSYDAWALAELERARAGKETTGALRYARQVLEVRRHLQERGVLR